MPRITLTEARVKALRPRRIAYDTRDGKLKGFGVRVLPSGAIAGRGASVSCPTTRSDGCPRVWKARTLYVNRCYLRNQLLSAHADRCPQQVAAIRLLLLTGCRNGELLTLRWADYREGHLFLRDSKTGPRTVWLSQPARGILDMLGRTSPWVFPASQGNRPRGASWLDLFWRRVRTEADLSDVRLHDLRHTHASLALRQGETVLAIGKLLGHRNPETTLKYIHLADPMVHEAAETVGAVLEG